MEGDFKVNAETRMQAAMSELKFAIAEAEQQMQQRNPMRQFEWEKLYRRRVVRIINAYNGDLSVLLEPESGFGEGDFKVMTHLKVSLKYYDTIFYTNLLHYSEGDRLVGFVLPGPCEITHVEIEFLEGKKS